MDLKERVQRLCREKGVTAQKAEMDLGFGKGYISKLNASTPNIAKIQKMAEYFGVTTDYLLGNVSEPFFYLDNARILREINSYDDEDEKKAPMLVSALLNSTLEAQEDLFNAIPPTREEAAVGAYRAFQSLHSGKPADFSDIPPEHADKVKKMYEFTMIASGLSDEDFDQLLALSRLLDKKDKRLIQQSTDDPID